jgi:hypothetical protein
LTAFSQKQGRISPAFGMEKGVLFERETLVRQNSAKISLNFGRKYFQKKIPAPRLRRGALT